MNKISIRYSQQRFTKEQNEAIDWAYSVATTLHEGQLRKDGQPYIIHPVAVAETVAEWGMGHEAVMAALLHDVVEDTGLTLTELSEQFGDKVAELVDGVTKIRMSALPSRPAGDSARQEASNENLRKLLLATAQDYQVILIKLADRLHNLRTLEYLKPEQRQRIARESLGVFAPLADRLGMGQVKAEIEDLGFKYAQPEDYVRLVQLVRATTRKSAHYLTLLKHDIRQFLKEGGIEDAEVEGRQKHLYSIHKKLAKVNGDIDKIYDLVAIRIVVPDEAACYHVLGLIHQHYKPLIYRIKDYIAVPKPNGYQSLHTTVFARDGHITEIQIRTPQMHAEAEHGLAAHFYYDAHKTSAAYAKGQGAGRLPDKLKWVGQLTDLQQATEGRSEFLEGARKELFNDQIFVFSPKGDLYDLPEGSTPLDFAFAVHSGLGLRTMGAKVNGRMVTLDHRLENRDVVELMTRREPSPNRDWLKFVKTTAAKNRIRGWFRAASREANIARGRLALEADLGAWGGGRIEDVAARQLADALDALHYKSLDDLLAAIGEGSTATLPVIRRLFPDAGKPASVQVVKRTEATGRILVEGGEELPYTLAPCCQPVFPQSVVGYITRGSGVTVHALGCSNLPNDMERFVGCRWETLDNASERLLCRLEVVAVNRVGLISSITGTIAREGLNISFIRSDATGPASLVADRVEEVKVSFAIEVRDLFELAGVMKRLEQLPGMISVRRL